MNTKPTSQRIDFISAMSKLQSHTTSGNSVVDAASELMDDPEVFKAAIPLEWFRNILTESGHADLPCVIILSDLVYWHRKRTNNKTGEFSPRFKGEEMYVRIKELMRRYSLSRYEVQRALAKLRSLPAERPLACTLSQNARTIPHDQN